MHAARCGKPSAAALGIFIVSAAVPGPVMLLMVEAREIPPMAVGNAYCTVIDTYHELFDLRRVAGDTARRDAR